MFYDHVKEAEQRNRALDREQVTVYVTLIGIAVTLIAALLVL